VHAIDLGAGANLPGDFTAALLADAMRKRASTSEGPALAAWLTGRAPDAPRLGPWL